MEHRREIDGLRALAVLPVILFHAGFGAFSGGFIGVDIFFVISGYLITSIIIAEKQAGTFTLIDFYERRARRILPALFFVMLVCLPFAWHFLYPSELASFSESLIAISSFVSNILFWRTITYFGPTAEHMPLLHTWSLSVEEQYYFLFPIFLIITWRFCKRWIVPILIVFALTSLTIAQWGAENKPDAAFFLLPTRGWELLVGALIAFHFDKRDAIAQSGLLAQAASFTGLLLIIYAVFAFNRHTPFPGLHALIPTFGTALIILFARPATIVGAALGNNILVGLGLVSYSAYLWHQPIFAFARHELIGEPGTFVLSLLSILVCILAYLTWRFIEQPFRRKTVVSKANIFIFSGLAMTMFVSLGIVGHVTRGFQELKLNGLQQAVLQTGLKSPKRNDCHTAGRNYLKPAAACEYLEKNITWAVLGNSHGVELAYALADQLRSRQKGLKHFTFSACEPLWGDLATLPDGCVRWTQETLAYIEGDSRIRTVVLSYRIHGLTYGEDGPGLTQSRVEQWTAYVALIERLVQAKKNVVFVLQAPQLTKRVQHFVMRERSNFEFVAGVSREQWERSASFEKARLRDLPPGVIVIDPTLLFCNELNCAAVKDGVALYFDDQHMSLAGSALIAAEIMRRVPNIKDILM